jgi:hypothetical protein
MKIISHSSRTGEMSVHWASFLKPKKEIPANPKPFARSFADSP